MSSPRQTHRTWAAEIAHNASFYLPVGIAIIVVFVPTSIALTVRWVLRLSDPTVGYGRLIPWVAGMSSLIALSGIVLTYYGLRCAAFPGSFLYRLTRLKRR
jgi:hypothetical protein